jgi:hypothetical protein
MQRTNRDKLSIRKRLTYALLSFLGGIWVGVIVMMLYLHFSGMMLPLEQIGYGVLGVMVMCGLLGFWKPKIMMGILFFVFLFQPS